MAASVLLGFAAIRRRDFTQHRAWMTRAYALALGAGTQAFTQGIGQGIFGKSVMTKDLSLIAGWAINLTVAEYAIRRNQRGRGRVRDALARRPELQLCPSATLGPPNPRPPRHLRENADAAERLMPVVRRIGRDATSGMSGRPCGLGLANLPVPRREPLAGLEGPGESVSVVTALVGQSLSAKLAPADSGCRLGCGCPVCG
jgi:hypothetical protein